MAESVGGPIDRPRKPWAAVLLSLLAPGLGHLYAGDLWGTFFSAVLVFFAYTVPITFALSHPAPSTIWLVWLGPLLIVLVVPIYAWLVARRAPRPYPLKPFNRLSVYLGAWLAWILVYGVAIESVRSEVIEAYRIPSGSMEPSVLVGDFIYVDKRAAARETVPRGAIITFTSVEEPDMTVIKRVVGIPGDTLSMVEGQLYRDGVTVAEPYVRLSEPKSEDPMQRAKMAHWQRDAFTGSNPAFYSPDLLDWGPIVVPDGAYFVLGDNRGAAYDSRYWGFVPGENVTGQPRVVYWSYDRATFLPLPFITAVRWDRIGRTFR